MSANDAKDAEDHRLQADDLIQQTRSADAAQAQTWLSYQAGVVGVLQTIGSFLTLLAAGAAAWYARQAAFETKRGADFAEEGVRAVVSANAADIRPYLFIDRIAFSHDTDRRFRVTIWLRNYGKIPARSIQAQTHCYVADIREPLSKNILKSDKVDIPVCAPGHERRVFDLTYLSEAMLEMVKERKLYIILRIRYRYRGIGPKPIFSERADYFCDGQGIKTDTFYILSSGAHERHSRLAELMINAEEPSFDLRPPRKRKRPRRKPRTANDDSRHREG